MTIMSFRVKYLTYIENFILNECTAREKEQFEKDIHNNQVLKEEYYTYLKIMEIIQSIEIPSSEVANEIVDFVFDPEIALTVEEFLYDKKIKRTGKKLSATIREILNSENQKRIEPFRGWLKAASVFIILLMFNPLLDSLNKDRYLVAINIVDLKPLHFNYY